MPERLTIAVGHYSDKGRKEINQDFHGLCVPDGALSNTKGIAVALADGISSSAVGHVASEAAVTGFLADYYCTPETWSVKRSAQRVLTATNSWLHAQTRQSQYRYDRDKGYVCTFSALILKGTTVHLFHVGDSRIYRFRNRQPEQLTNDHRLWISQDQSYLSRALGVEPHLEIDYQALPIDKDDIFVSMTDGVYEYVPCGFVADAIEQNRNDLDAAAQTIVNRAFAEGSTDNLTIQIVRIDDLPERSAGELYRQFSELPLPPILQARMAFDGYTVIRELHASSRSHVYLAIDDDTSEKVVLKTPSIDRRDDPAYLERFLIEDWIARRIDSLHVLKPCKQVRKRNYLYTVTEFIDGQTLTQWMLDNPKPDLETTRDIVEQIAKGLRAFHRLEMLHQDLRPDNIMIDRTGTVKIIDFGSTRVAGLLETATAMRSGELLGTAPYSAPEYFLGEGGTARSDLFSLGVIAYQMLTGRLPYGTEVAKARTRAAQSRLSYRSAIHGERAIPAWIDDALRQAVHPNPQKRYEALSEFIHDLRQPNPRFLNRTRPPLIERNPVIFWKGVSLVLCIAIVIYFTTQPTETFHYGNHTQPNTCILESRYATDQGTNDGPDRQRESEKTTDLDRDRKASRRR